MGNKENGYPAKNQEHGNHWDAIFADEKKKEKLFATAIKTSIEDGFVYGSAETLCTIEENEKEISAKRKCFILAYDGLNHENEQSEDLSDFEALKAAAAKRDKMQIKAIIAEIGESNVLVSAYPVVPNGRNCRLKLVKIDEWENRLEAVLECETESGIEISFFDTDYLLHKDMYKEDEVYYFKLSGLVYYGNFLSKDEAFIEITGDAANARRKDLDIGDDWEFQSNAKGSKDKFDFFGAKLTGGYSITIFRDIDEDDNEIEIPIVIADKNLSGKATGKKTLQGTLWLQGYYVSDEDVLKEKEELEYFKSKILDSLNSFFDSSEKEAEEEKWTEDGMKKRMMLSYDKVPFNMLGRFESYDFWDEDLSYEFDVNMPLGKINPKNVPIEFGKTFSTPFFTLKLLVDNEQFLEGVYRLMYGERPTEDDGEPLPKDKEQSA